MIGNELNLQTLDKQKEKNKIKKKPKKYPKKLNLSYAKLLHNSSVKGDHNG